MIVFTGEVFSDGSKNVLCSECGAHIGRMGGDEIRALTVSPYRDLYCFLCDSVGADSVHPALLEHVRVYDQTFVCRSSRGPMRGFKTVFKWGERGGTIER